MNLSEQVQRSVVLLNAQANGTLPRALSTLGYMSAAERGQMCKASGMSDGQFTEWLDGRWCPPVDQCLVVLSLALDRFYRSFGRELVAS